MKCKLYIKRVLVGYAKFYEKLELADNILAQHIPISFFFPWDIIPRSIPPEHTIPGCNNNYYIMLCIFLRVGSVNGTRSADGIHRVHDIL